MAARLTPARRWALGFFALAAGCVAAWLTTNAADDWMPNAATTAVGIGLTVTLIEWIVRSEQRRRLGPRLEYLRRRLRGYLDRYCEIVAMDYKLRGGTAAFPKDMLALLDQWLEEVDQLETDPRSPCVRPTLQLGKQIEVELRNHRVQDLDILEPALVRAIDEYLEKSVAGDVLMLFANGSDDRTNAFSIRRAETTYVEAACRLGEAVVAWDKDGGPLEFSDSFLAATAET
jgi:hypothetical protein